MPTAYVALGSNFQPLDQIQHAIQALNDGSDWHLTATSRCYRSPDIDTVNEPMRQAQYVNAVVALTTNLSASELRHHLRTLEIALGRDRRTPNVVAIDLDLIAVDAAVIDFDGKHLPAPEIQQYAFVAVPFAEIAPDWVHPETGRQLSEIAAELRQQLELEIVVP